MSHKSDQPILITGAAGDVGAIGRTLTGLLIERGHRVRAMVRRQDERAEALRESGAEVVIGDLLDLHSMHAAIEGCSRIYFGMSVSPAYLEATVNTAAVALHHGVEAFVNMSQMTVSQMSITETTASPQHKLHWLSEQALNWSGLPVVHVRPTVFMEGFFLRFAAAGIKKADKLSLPMGSGRTSPICAQDVARSVAVILSDPQPHLGKIYDLTGPQSEDLNFYAREFSSVLERPITYEDIDPDAWKEKLARAGLPSHLIEHVTAMAALNREHRYDRSSDNVQRLTGTPAISLRTFIGLHAKSFV
jgi:uncharacterized protein YbjT (DUF2867 family)